MSVHLVCNAHLDPAWLWELDEGAAEVLSTFRIAADFCDGYDGFVFNHNESILYEWVLEYDPALFARIQRLVGAGKWHIMGGWFLQPDCTMPGGESFVRQITEGRRFFDRHFGVRPTAAINFDPFGHTRGLVQILARSGYTSYVHCRPGTDSLRLPAEYFTWVGYDGSQVVVARRPGGYNSRAGDAVAKARSIMKAESDNPHALVLWGIGNHGGGPSRQDLEEITALQAEAADAGVRHSTPEHFFADLTASGTALPEWRGDLNPWAPGCYTSQVRIKQEHRRLENQLYAGEKLAVHAALLGAAAYPAAELADARHDLLTAEFHDILPGSSIRPVEEAALRLLGHGREILSRVRRRLFFSLAAQLAPPLGAGVIPVLAYNSSPADADGVWECEFQMSGEISRGPFTEYQVYHDRTPVPSQVEHEQSSLTVDWRKRVVFRASLPASSMTRFTCVPIARDARPQPTLAPIDGRLTISGESVRLVINAKTGLVDELTVGGRSFLHPGAFAPLLMADNEDAWGSDVRSFRTEAGTFALMSNERAAEYSGLTGAYASGRSGTVGTPGAVRVIEQGPVRVVVETFFEHHDSVCILRYTVPLHGAWFDLNVAVNWQEKNRMLKLSVPTCLSDSRLLGQVAYGVAQLPDSGDEVVTQQWQAVVGGTGGSSADGEAALAVIDDGVYGSDFSGGELRISLLRGAVYSSLTMGERPLIIGDRHHPRIDQGERFFSFRFAAGSAEALLSQLGTMAQQFNESPYLLSMFTSGTKDSLPAGLRLKDPAVLCGAFKQADDGEGHVVRLFNTTGSERSGMATVGAAPALQLAYRLGPWEVRSYRVTAGGLVAECNLLEEAING